jgi:hypothetical protein
MPWNRYEYGKTQGNENLRETTPVQIMTSEATGECAIFKLFG